MATQSNAQEDIGRGGRLAAARTINKRWGCTPLSACLCNDALNKKNGHPAGWPCPAGGGYRRQSGGGGGGTPGGGGGGEPEGGAVWRSQYSRSSRRCCQYARC